MIMKRFFPISYPLSCALLVIILFTGCKKEHSDSLNDNEEQQAALETSVAETEAEFAYNDVFDNAMGVSTEVGVGGVGVFGKIIRLSGRLLEVDTTRCFTVTISPQQPGVFPKTVEINFGNGCTSQGHTRYGKIKTIYTGRLTQPGSSATTTFDNYQIDSVRVEGSQKITNITPSGTAQRQYEVQVTEGRLTKPSGNFVLWQSHRTIKQVEGNGTESGQDDIFSINGTEQGKVKANGFIFSWNSEITEPLMKKFICRWISKGRIKTIRETLPSDTRWLSVLDYGNGDCDNKAVITINGLAHQITLR